jgi:hypothetical protein
MTAAPILIGLPFGLAPLLFGAWQIRRELVPRTWHQVSGLILSSKIDEKQSGYGEIVFTPVVEYEYRVNDKPYKSSRRRIRAFTSGQKADAEAVTARYRVGNIVTVYVDPRDPQKSVLEYGVSPLSWVPLALGLVFISLSLIPLLVK